MVNHFRRSGGDQPDTGPSERDDALQASSSLAAPVDDPSAPVDPSLEPVVVETARVTARDVAFDPTDQAGFTSVFAPLQPTDEDESHINRSGAPTISMRDVTKIYPAQPNKPALENVSLDIYPGEFVFLVGHSGSGKSTFIKLLIRELRATSGKVIVAGQDLTTMRNWKVPYLRRQIGCVFQDFKLLPDKTTYENVAFTLECIGKPRSVVKAQVPEVLRLVGLQEKMDMYPDQLSGGEQQRVAIARAIAKNPRLLLCDEPTGALDYATGKQVLQLLQDACRNTGRTVAIVTHNLAFTRIADRVIHVREGRAASIEVNPRPDDASTVEW